MTCVKLIFLAQIRTLQRDCGAKVMLQLRELRFTSPPFTCGYITWCKQTFFFFLFFCQKLTLRIVFLCLLTYTRILVVTDITKRKSCLRFKRATRKRLLSVSVAQIKRKTLGLIRLVLSHPFDRPPASALHTPQTSCETVWAEFSRSFFVQFFFPQCIVFCVFIG